MESLGYFVRFVNKNPGSFYTAGAFILMYGLALLFNQFKPFYMCFIHYHH